MLTCNIISKYKLVDIDLDTNFCEIVIVPWFNKRVWGSCLLVIDIDSLQACVPIDIDSSWDRAHKDRLCLVWHWL